MRRLSWGVLGLLAGCQAIGHDLSEGLKAPPAAVALASTQPATIAAQAVAHEGGIVYAQPVRDGIQGAALQEAALTLSTELAVALRAERAMRDAGVLSSNGAFYHVLASDNGKKPGQESPSPAATPEPKGNGNGASNGNGAANGNGGGASNGNANGAGNGTNNGNANGASNGHANGASNGNGAGNGNANGASNGNGTANSNANGASNGNGAGNSNATGNGNAPPASNGDASGANNGNGPANNGNATTDGSHGNGSSNAGNGGTNDTGNGGNGSSAGGNGSDNGNGSSPNGNGASNGNGAANGNAMKARDEQQQAAQQQLAAASSAWSSLTPDQRKDADAKHQAKEALQHSQLQAVIDRRSPFFARQGADQTIATTDGGHATTTTFQVSGKDGQRMINVTRTYDPAGSLLQTSVALKGTTDGVTMDCLRSETLLPDGSTSIVVDARVTIDGAVHDLHWTLDDHNAGSGAIIRPDGSAVPLALADAGDGAQTLQASSDGLAASLTLQPTAATATCRLDAGQAGRADEEIRLEAES